MMSRKIVFGLVGLAVFAACLCGGCGGGNKKKDNGVENGSGTDGNRQDLVSYVILFDADGGTLQFASDTVSSDGKLKTLPAPVKTGYSFIGWYTAKTGGALVDTSTVFTKNATIYARWGELASGDSGKPAASVAFKVTFDANGGDVSLSSDSTDSNGKLSFLPSPLRSGYVFVGWFTTKDQAGVAVTTNTKYTENTTIYARWDVIPDVNTPLITFDAYGGVVTPTYNNVDDDGQLATLPTPKRDGYSFGGWYTDAVEGEKVTVSTVFSKNATIYARWTIETYTITFNADGGTVTPASGTTGGDWRLGSLPTPVRGGYDFGGWYTSHEGGGDKVTAGTVFTGSITVFASWTIKSYTVTFNGNGGTLTSSSMTTGTDWKLASLPTATRLGYDLEGWFTAASGGEAVTLGKVYSEDTQVYAHWLVVNTYTIRFNPNDGVVDTATTMTNADGTPKAWPTPQKNGSAFLGWFTAKTGGTEVFKTNKFTEDAEIFAHWVPSYIITFDPNSGTIKGSVTPVTYSTGVHGTVVDLPTAEDVEWGSYIFKGWARSPGGELVTAATVFSKAETVKAVWDIEKFTDARDNKVYGQVKIGGYWWMAEDLNYDNPKDNTDACYEDIRTSVVFPSGTCVDYGRLYFGNQLAEVCPTGWKLPDTAAWSNLFSTVGEGVGGAPVAAMMLKTVEDGYWSSYATKSDNRFGFSALPGGYVSNNNVYELTSRARWWTATVSQYNAGSRFFVEMSTGNSFTSEGQGFFLIASVTSYRYSVRCVMDTASAK